MVGYLTVPLLQKNCRPSRTRVSDSIDLTRIRIQPFLIAVSDQGFWWPKLILQPSKENIQNFKTWNYFTFLYFLWVIFALLDPNPDPATQINAHPSETLARRYKFITETFKGESVTWLRHGEDIDNPHCVFVHKLSQHQPHHLHGNACAYQ